MKYKVYVAFGFHVNCYHSYRGDSCDSHGFGNDIKIMRDEIKVLDTFNEQGVPVKGTWDFENAYSLEKILPVYAPDIISAVRRRTIENGDENILMGYDNGAMSAMTDSEFKANIDLALTNDKGSGLIDCFSKARRIIRPQEVMFSPAQMKIYKACQIEALCLYNCCVPFDAMRSIIKPMKEEMMYNYVSYVYGKNKLTVLPTYCQSDLMDIGSLGLLCLRLNRLQEKGEINNDCLIFINMDADSFLWEPLPVLPHMKKWPNMNGLKGLIDEVKDYDFVSFTTPGEYLDSHEPVGEITFGQDVADGNFTGYSSWSEKPFNRLIWTRLERARLRARLAKKDQESESFNDRISLLSTTHFGLASPVLNIDREKAALEISKRCNEEDRVMERKSTKPDSITIYTPEKESLIHVQLKMKEGMYQTVDEILVSSTDFSDYTIFKMDEYEDGSIKTITLLADVDVQASKHLVTFAKTLAKQEPRFVKEKIEELQEGDYIILFNEEHKKVEILHRYLRMAMISSYIKYDGKRYDFSRPVFETLCVGGTGKGVSLKGEIHLPNEIQPGSYEYQFIISPVINGLIFFSHVNYPYTKETDQISSQASSLGRYSDNKWESVVPFQFHLNLNQGAILKKRAFNDEITKYQLNSFMAADPKNFHLDTMNHQLSGGYLELSDSEKGIVIAHARQVSGSMAHNPIRLSYDAESQSYDVKINPYGHYFGSQRHYPSECGGLITTIYNLTMPQATSLAPSYNGAMEEAIQLLVPRGVEKVNFDDILSFADGAIASYHENGNVTCDEDDHVRTHSYEESKNTRLKKTHSNGNSSLLVSSAYKLLRHIKRTRRKVKALEKVKKISDKRKEA